MNCILLESCQNFCKQKEPPFSEELHDLPPILALNCHVPSLGINRAYTCPESPASNLRNSFPIPLNKSNRASLPVTAGALLLQQCGEMADTLKSRLRTKLFRRVSTAVPASGELDDRVSNPPEPRQQSLHHHNTLPTIASLDKQTSIRGTKRTPTAKSSKNSDGSNKNDGTARPGTGERSESLKSADIRTLESSLSSIPSTTQSPAEGQSDILIHVTEATPGSPPTSSSTAQTIARDNIPQSEAAQKFSKIGISESSDPDAIKEILQDAPHPLPIPSHVLPERHTPTILGTSARASDDNMPHIQQRIWIKRPGATATRVAVYEDDYVDDAKDTILRKYSNALGRHYDSPELTMHLYMRGSHVERLLNPDEHLWSIIKETYPGGQTIDEALIIEVPPRRTPRVSSTLR